MWGAFKSFLFGTDTALPPAPTPPENMPTSIVRAILLGPPSVGKTTLWYMYKDENYYGPVMTTLGLEFCVKKLQFDQDTIRLQFWDTAGQERFRASMSAQYYRNVQLAILVYDVTDAATLEAVEKYVQELRTHVPKDETVVMLIGNKNDLDQQRQVSTNQGLEFAIRLKIPLFFEICAIKEYSVVERVVNIGARASYDARKYKYSMQQINQIYNNGSWYKIDGLFEQRMLERIKDRVLSDVIVNCT